MTIDLKLFCAAADDYRSHLHTPALTAHGICATNGHILICVPGTDAPDIWDGSLKKAMDFYAALPVSADAVAIDDTLILPPLTPCPCCSGSGYIWQMPCDECNGKGGHTHGRNWYECLECDGEGHVEEEKKHYRRKETHLQPLQW